MQISTQYRLIGVPVMHAAFLAGWSLIDPANGPRPLLYWLLWPLFLLFMLQRTTFWIIMIGSAPFVACASYQWILA